MTIALVNLLETIGQFIWPYMNGVNVNDAMAVKAAIAHAPVTAMLWVVMSYALAGLAGSFLACKVGGGLDAKPSWMVGAVLLLMCAMNDATIPQPIWMSAASLLVPLPAAWAGFRLAAIRR